MSENEFNNLGTRGKSILYYRLRLSDMRTLVEAMEHASKKMHLKEAE